MNLTEENKKDLNMVLKKGSLLRLLEGNTIRRGNKALAEAAILKVFRTIKFDKPCNLNHYLFNVVLMVQPLVSIVSKKVGGGVYKIPVYIYSYKSRSLSLKWVVESSSERKSGNFVKKLRKELIDSLKGEGSATKRRKVLHSLAVANRAYIKYL